MEETEDDDVADMLVLTGMDDCEGATVPHGNVGVVDISPHEHAGSDNA